MIEHIQADMHIYKEKWENIKEWLAQAHCAGIQAQKILDNLTAVGLLALLMYP